MSHLSGIFDIFDNLDQIKVENIARWLRPQPQLLYIENYLAQRILYPQTIPITETDLKIDLAILREIIRMTGPKKSDSQPMLGDNPFLNKTLRKVLIPSHFLDFVPDITTLVWTFVDALLLGREKEDSFEDLWTVILTGETDEVVGTILLPEFVNQKSVMQLLVLGQNFEIRPGMFMVIPCPKQRCEISFNLKQGKILGKEDLAVEVYGGRLGLMIDGRGYMK